jgi:hypothetical protein
VSPRPRTAWLLALIGALAAGFFVGGPWLYRAAIGLDPSAFPGGALLDAAGKAVLPRAGLSIAGIALVLLTLLVTAFAGMFVVGRSMRRAAPADAPRTPARRAFLRLGAGAAAAAAGLAGVYARAFAGLGNGGRGWGPVAGEIFAGDVERTAPDPKPAWRESRVRAYRRLGRTGFLVSDITMGTGPTNQSHGTDLVRMALSRGVNYIDTSPDYASTGSERHVGAGIAGLDRSKLFLATKFCTPDGHLPAGTPVERYVLVVEQSLARLGTDYVDLVHVHACDEVERLLDPNMHEAFARLRDAGKVRFLGFSTHTPNLTQVVTAAIESGRFDVMMLAYHHGIWPELTELIARARREQDMGVVAMKTLKGAKHHGLAGFREHADAYSQAALRWTLSNPDVSCAVISMFDHQHVDEYLVASGGALAPSDVAVLDAYDRQIVGTYCAPHCGRCLSACPEGVPIHDVLRHRMYFEDYGREKMAMEGYAKLRVDASACASCSAPCAGSCPVGIAIPHRTREAHEMLTLA